jgi:hypothetical protein
MIALLPLLLPAREAVLGEVTPVGSSASVALDVTKELLMPKER